MRLRLTKQILCVIAAATWAVSSGSASANDGSFIVASQVVSDTVAPATAFVGDLASATISDGCADGSCGASASCGDCGAGLLGRFCNAGNGGGAGCQPRKYDRPDLFYNFYSQGNCNSANAQMYISPVPVPQFVGHTFNTYQPLYPHEFMYRHQNRYHNNYDNGRGMNRTKVKYSYPPVRTAVTNLYWNKLRLPR